MERLHLKIISKDLTIIFAATFLITFLIWLPHLLQLNNFLGLNFSNGFNTIYRNFDGLEYVFVAKTLYSEKAFLQIPQSLPFEYYASRFPLYSLLIIIFSPLLGYLKSMLFVSLLFTFLSAAIFYLLLKRFRLTTSALFLSVLFLILPARWLITHSVGSAEPIFIFFILSSIYCFLEYEGKQRFIWLLWAGVLGGLAQLTKSPGALLFIAYGVYLSMKLFKGNLTLKGFSKYFPLSLMPIALLIVFYIYSLPWTFNDLWAYFKSGDNIHLSFPPFQVFNKYQYWVGDIWLEDILYILLLSFLGGVMLIKQKLKLFGIFVLTYCIATSLVIHRDISRYIIPVYPFLLIAFEKVLVSKEFKIVLAILALGIYLYSQNFIVENTAPFPNLEVFD